MKTSIKYTLAFCSFILSFPYALNGYTQEAPNTRDEFFGSTKMYYARVKNWDPSRLDPARLAEYSSTPGASFELFLTDAHDPQHCPDSRATSDQLLYKSGDFDIKTGGNKTKGTPKSSYKFKFTGKQEKFLDQKVLHFRSMWNDPSQMRETLALKFFKMARVLSPRQTYAKLCVNDRYLGLYSLTEELDETFLADRFPANDQGNLYKGQWVPEDLGPATLAYRGKKDQETRGEDYFRNSDPELRTYVLKTKLEKSLPTEIKPYDDLAILIGAVNGFTKDADSKIVKLDFKSKEYQQELESVFDVNPYLRWAAVNFLLGAWDNYWLSPNNFLLYNKNSAAEKRPYFQWIPWDYDHSFGLRYDNRQWQYAHPLHWRSMYQDESASASKIPLIDNLLQNPDYKKYYLNQISDCTKKFFNPSFVKGQISTLWEHIQTAVFLESDFPDCRNSGPFPCAHTGRQYTNDQIYQHVVNQNELEQGSLKAEGIVHYVRMRRDWVAWQLKDLSASGHLK